MLILGAVLIVGILWLASGGSFQKKFDLYLAIEDESVAGLNVNAPVKYSGVDVGKVKSIQLDPGNPERVNLIFAIQHSTPIRQDTVAVLKTQGLTGIAYVELSNATRSSPPLQKTPGYEYPLIRTKPSLSARLENVVTTVLASVDSTAKHIDSILSDQNQQNFKNTLADMAAITHTLALRKDSIDRSLRNAELTLNNTTRLTAQAGPVLDKIGRGAESIDAAGKSVSRTSTDLGKTLNSVGSDLKGFTDVSLPELDRLIGELNTLSASMRRLSEQTERNPDSLLFGITPVPNGPGETTPAARKP